MPSKRTSSPPDEAGDHWSSHVQRGPSSPSLKRSASRHIGSRMQRNASAPASRNVSRSVQSTIRSIRVEPSTRRRRQDMDVSDARPRSEAGTSRTSGCLAPGCPCQDARIVSHRRAQFFSHLAGGQRRNRRPGSSHRSRTGPCRRLPTPTYELVTATSPDWTASTRRPRPLRRGPSGRPRSVIDLTGKKPAIATTNSWPGLEAGHG